MNGMKHPWTLTFLLLFAVFFYCGPSAAETSEGLFPTLESREEFAKDMSSLVSKAWRRWQDSILVNDVDVEGSYGILRPGGLKGPVLTASSILSYFDRSGRPQDYIGCVKAVAEAVESGMRKWQKGYAHRNIPFPQGASCTYTLPPCNNMPVVVSSGSSPGAKDMSETELYNYMLYRAPRQEESTLVVLRASAGAISECFARWEDSCSIVGILASGGIAPQPAPMGSGPGPVKGAKGNDGKLVGAYFNGKLMYARMVAYFRKQKTEVR